MVWWWCIYHVSDGVGTCVMHLVVLVVPCIRWCWCTVHLMVLVHVACIRWCWCMYHAFNGVRACTMHRMMLVNAWCVDHASDGVGACSMHLMALVHAALSCVALGALCSPPSPPPLPTLATCFAAQTFPKRLKQQPLGEMIPILLYHPHHKFCATQTSQEKGPWPLGFGCSKSPPTADVKDSVNVLFDHLPKTTYPNLMQWTCLLGWHTPTQNAMPRGGENTSVLKYCGMYEITTVDGSSLFMYASTSQS